MRISRLTYYYSSKKGKFSEADLADRINDIALKYPYYGYQRTVASLKRAGIVVNHKKVYRIMKDKNILCRIRKSYHITTNSAHSLTKYPNLIKNIVASHIDQIWHDDITYIRISASFVYLAAIIDSYSRKVVGYGLGRTLSAALTCAIEKRKPESSLIHHSGQGIQYCSSDYIKILNEHDINISMSSKANPYDNAKIELFFRSLKVEEVYMFSYETYKEVKDRIPYFIEEVYNRKRLHSSLGYMPPEEFENIIINKDKENESHQLVLT